MVTVWVEGGQEGPEDGLWLWFVKRFLAFLSSEMVNEENVIEGDMPII